MVYFSFVSVVSSAITVAAPATIDNAIAPVNNVAIIFFFIEKPPFVRFANYSFVFCLYEHISIRIFYLQCT